MLGQRERLQESKNYKEDMLRKKSSLSEQGDKVGIVFLLIFKNSIFDYGQ